MTIRTKYDAAGNLVITADNEGRRDLAEAFALGGYVRAEDFVMDEICPNSELCWIPPEDIGALTEAPIIGEALPDDDGRMVPFGRVWWYPDYQLRDAWDELRRKGRVVFTLAPVAEPAPEPRPLDSLTKRVLSALYGVTFPKPYTFGRAAFVALAVACGAANAHAAPVLSASVQSGPIGDERDRYGYGVNACDVDASHRDNGAWYVREVKPRSDRWRGPFLTLRDALQSAADRGC